MTDEKVRENRLRRVAGRRGMRIEKSRRRDRRAFDFGGYMLIDTMGGGGIILGSEPTEYSASLELIESYLDDKPAGAKPAAEPKPKAQGQK